MIPIVVFFSWLTLVALTLSIGILMDLASESYKKLMEYMGSIFCFVLIAFTIFMYVLYQ